MSENASLKLSRVTDAHAGGYTLTVNTGNKSLYKEFIITVLIATETTSLWMGELGFFFFFPFGAVSLFVSHSISAFPQGWINHLAEGPRD